MAKEDKKIVATVLYPGMTALDLVGSSQALMGLDLRSPYQTVKVAESMDPIQTDTALMVIPNQTFGELPAPYCLVVPGGEAALTVGHNETLRRYVQTAADAADYVVSIGTGSLILAAAGLLKGRQATTHWAYAKHLEEYGSHYTRQRWVEDGKFTTAAGVTAGIDLALYLMEKLTSTSKAREMQLWIEYDPQPPFGSIDWSRVDREATEPGQVTDGAGSNGTARHDDQAMSTITKERV